MNDTGRLRLGKFRPWLGALFAAAIGASSSVMAAADDDDRIATLERKLDQSLERIEELTARVRELEAQHSGPAPSVGPHAPASAVAGTAAPAAATPGSAPAAAAAAPAATATDSAQRVSQLEQSVAELASSAAQHAEDLGVPLHAFADVGIGNHNPEFPEYHGAGIAELDFFLTPRLGSRTRALFELNFEVGEDGEVGVDLERAQIGYQLGDSTTVWAGRFHTPYGYYNTAFHHGQQIATSLRRPRFLEFEDHGGVMPAHTVGLWLTGTQRVGGEKVTFDAYVGNSQRIVDGTLDPNNAGVQNGSTIFGGNLGLLLSGALDGLKIGVDAFQTRIENQDVTPSYFTLVRSFGTYAAYDTDSWEDIAELHFFNNEDLTGNTGRHRSEAGFVQLGYRAGRFTPYTRYERGSFQQSDNYFAAQKFGDSYERMALGVRFDVDLQSALKMELAQTHISDRDISTFYDVLLQYAIRF
jgi:hypothetical protein